MRSSCLPLLSTSTLTLDNPRRPRQRRQPRHAQPRLLQERGRRRGGESRRQRQQEGVLVCLFWQAQIRPHRQCQVTVAKFACQIECQVLWSNAKKIASTFIHTFRSGDLSSCNSSPQNRCGGGGRRSPRSPGSAEATLCCEDASAGAGDCSSNPLLPPNPSYGGDDCVPVMLSHLGREGRWGSISMVDG